MYCVSLTEIPAETCPLPDDCEQLTTKLEQLANAVSSTTGTMAAELQACLDAHEAHEAQLGCE